MNTDNITKGKFKTITAFATVFGLTVSEVSNENEWIAQVRGNTDIERKENAVLILQAFNVAQETGLSPIQMKERIKELEEALQKARSTIKVMKMINNALNPKTEKCKCEFPLVRNDGKEYCGNCNEDI